MASDEWHYEHEGASSGPHPKAEIERRVASGGIGRRTRVWQAGMADWEPAEKHFPFDESHAEFGTNPGGLHPGAPARGFGEAISVCLRNYVTFSGRASRSEFWFFVLFTILLTVVLGSVDAALFGVEDPRRPISAVGDLAVTLPYFAVLWRRLHDTGRSGWYAGGLLLFVAAGSAIAGILWPGAAGDPEDFAAIVRAYGVGVVAYIVIMIAYFLMVLVFLVQKGEPGPNRYG